MRAEEGQPVSSWAVESGSGMEERRGQGGLSVERSFS